MLDAYVGMPFVEHGRSRDGCDCYGLLRLVYMEQLGIVLPAYSEAYASTQDGPGLQALITDELPPWRSVSPEIPLDAVLMTEGGVIRHVGVVERPGWVLHVEDGGAAVIEPYRHGRLKRRVVGFYRHESDRRQGL